MGVPDDARRTGGFILLTAVLVLALLALATPALVYTGAQAQLLARARLDALRARLAARSAVHAALIGWRTSTLDAHRPGEVVTLVEPAPFGETRQGVTLERLDATSWLLRGRGWVGPPGWPRAEAAVALRVAAPDLAAAGLTPGITEAPDPLRLPGWPEPALLHRLADTRLTGEVSLSAQARSGDCDVSRRDNWGAPGQPSHPCAAFFPLIYVPGALTVVDGWGQGVLVVEGDLVLGADVRFQGLVLVGGRLTLEPGARIDGALRILPGAGPAPEALRADARTLGEAIAGSPGLNRPLRPVGRAWLPIF